MQATHAMGSLAFASSAAAISPAYVTRYDTTGSMVLAYTLAFAHGAAWRHRRRDASTDQLMTAAWPVRSNGSCMDCEDRTCPVRCRGLTAFPLR